jgi:hypothetical protein
MIRNIGTIDITLHKTAAWVAETERRPREAFFPAVGRNDKNLSEILKRQKDPRVLVLASGGCEAFSLSKIVERASQVTLADIRQEALREAEEKVPAAERGKIELVQADLSLYDSGYYAQASVLIERAASSRQALDEFHAYLADPANLKDRPLEWYAGQANLIILVDAVSHVSNSTLLCLENKVLEHWQGKSRRQIGWRSLPNDQERMMRIETLFFRTFMKEVKAKLAGGGLIYFAGISNYRDNDGRTWYPQGFYRRTFVNDFRIFPNILPYKNLNGADGYDRICALMGEPLTT